MTTQEKLMTVEEFEARYQGQPYELVEGRIVEVSPTVSKHGKITGRVAHHLWLYLDENPIGDIFGAEAGFRLAPDTVRAPDAAFVGDAKLELEEDEDKYFPFPPDLAVEVVSPGDRADDIQAKINLYIKAGTPLLWVMYSKPPYVAVYELGKPMRTVAIDGVLDGGDVLPGLQLAVAKLYPPARKRTRKS